MRTVICKANIITRCVIKYRYLWSRKGEYCLSVNTDGFKRNFSLHIMDEVHIKTKTGFLDGQNYERNRPSYTDEVVQIISSIIQEEVSSGVTYRYNCLELGAGTGKFTQKIIECLPQGTKYLATEPMSGFLDTLKAKCPKVETLQCSADKLPLSDSSVKTVVAAQCFHWFATEEALNEIHRVLSPNGKFVLLWNHKRRIVPWLQELDAILTANYGDTPRAINKEWKALMETYPKFKCIRHSMLDGIKWKGSREDIVNHFGSISVIAALDSETKPVVLQEFRDVLDKTFDENIDEIDMPFETELYVCSKV